MQIIFQDPVSSLNPHMTVGRIIGEPLEVHGIARGKDRDDLVASLLQRVGLDPGYASRYPHEFSGGQKQRIGIARALGLSPRLIVCDEPVSALDVSIQSQILNLLNDLQRERGSTYLFIAHNLAVVEHFSDEVAVMYLGKIVEKADAKRALPQPQAPLHRRAALGHPRARPPPAQAAHRAAGRSPLPHQPPSGCSFPPALPAHPRNVPRAPGPLTPSRSPSPSSRSAS